VGASRTGAKRRHWADVVAIVTGLALLGLAIWPGSPSASAGAAIESGRPDYLWLGHALAGGIALLGVTAAQRWGLRSLGRSLLIIAGLGLVALLVMFHEFGPRAILTVLLPALLLLAAAASVGPMPREL
jgi:peptidoglycan/LPS O-acetylase OafA/YrhL